MIIKSYEPKRYRHHICVFFDDNCIIDVDEEHGFMKDDDEISQYTKLLSLSLKEITKTIK